MRPAWTHRVRVAATTPPMTAPVSWWRLRRWGFSAAMCSLRCRRGFVADLAPDAENDFSQ
jgi:hypothetical protein